MKRDLTEIDIDQNLSCFKVYNSYIRLFSCTMELDIVKK
jgi:hypothetical protein